MADDRTIAYLKTAPTVPQVRETARALTALYRHILNAQQQSSLEPHYLRFLMIATGRVPDAHVYNALESVLLLYYDWQNEHCTLLPDHSVVWGQGWVSEAQDEETMRSYEQANDPRLSAWMANYAGDPT
jgi:hypothetical protein